MKNAVDTVAEQVVMEALLDEIKREDMPQIPTERLPEFKEHLENMGVLVTVEHIDPGDLKPTQEGYDEEKLRGIAEDLAESESLAPPIVSEDYYIMDGHHRAGAVELLNKQGGNSKLPIVRMHMERDDALQACMDFEKRLGEEKDMEQVVVMAGRFHPFHKAHYQKYKKLESRFGTNNVYVITSNRTRPPKAPFTFEDKERMMTKLYGIPSTQIIETDNAYNPQEVLEDYDPETTAFVMALDSPDAKQVRNSGLSEYFNEYDADGLIGYGEQGYIYEMEGEDLKIKEHSVPGKNVYKVFSDDNVSERTKKAFFQEVFGTFDKELFGLVNEKFTEEPMSVELVEKFVRAKEHKLLKEYSKTASAAVDDGPTTWWEEVEAQEDWNEETAEMIGFQVLDYMGNRNNFSMKRDGLPYDSFYPSGKSGLEDWELSDPESLYREFSSRVATGAGFEMLDWLENDLEFADMLVRHETAEDIVDKLTTNNMKGDDGPLADVLAKVDDPNV